MKLDDLENQTSVDGPDERGPLSWEGFLHEIEDVSEGWLFRGCRSANWDLQTSLERHAPSDQKPSQAEEFLLREFKRRADVYLDANQVPSTALEWLALQLVLAHGPFAPSPAFPQTRD